MNKNYFIKNMPEVNEYQVSLDSLSERWNLLTLLGQMSNIGMDMSETRQGFQELTDRLLERLSHETLTKLTSEMEAKAQVAVDIVIRNLFERTADIGFLATDDDIRRYIRELANTDNDDEGRRVRKQHHDSLVHRFQEYVAKYSVYSNIILLDVNGRVIAQLDSKNKIEQSNDIIIQRALSTNEDYVEVYHYSDLQAEKNKSLIYGFRVTETNDPSSEPLGVLCLIFRFENEMEGVFNDLMGDADWMEIMLLDDDGCVISSSDPYHIPVGVKLQKVLDKEYQLVRFAGREYLSKTCKTQGYEGFKGLGWYGHVMIPTDAAFIKNAESVHMIEDKMMRRLVSASTLFSDDLIDIPCRADRIQRELDVTVWNGNVQIANTKSGDNSFSKTLLNEISKTGARTKKVFEDSISDLNQTVISSYYEVAEFHAHLAVDIMDRNLYERANDCRWWALTTRFREILAQADCSESESAEMSDILAYINNLYTVYTNLFIYDTAGIIKAVSQPSAQHLVGTKLSDDWVSKTLNIHNSQDYSVSTFEKSDLYNGRHTYIYGASITNKDNDQVNGGIGIVFDSQPQFHEMLKDALPKNESGDVIAGCFGIFVDQNKSVVTSTSKQYTVGTQFSVEDRFINAGAEGLSDIIEMDGKYYVLGASNSVGYREYKVSDEYINNITSLVYMEIGDVDTETSKIEVTNIYDFHYPQVQAGEEVVELSTFIVNEKLFALESKYIVCSLNNQEITSVIGADDRYLGIISFMRSNIPIVSLRKELNGATGYDKDNDCIVVTRVTDNDGDEILVGLVIDRVIGSPEISKRHLTSCDRITNSGSERMTKFIIQPEQDAERSSMLLVLDIEAISRNIFGSGAQSNDVTIVDETIRGTGEVLQLDALIIDQPEVVLVDK